MFDDLNKDGSQKLIYLNSWFPVGGTVGEDLGGSCEQMCHMGQFWGFKIPHTISTEFSLLFMVL